MTTAAQTNQTIDALIRAQCPLIAITTREEQRVLAAMREIAGAAKQKKQVIEWSASIGFDLTGVGDDVAAPLKNKVDPMAALEAILRFEVEARVIFALKDFHPYFNNPRIVRLLKDIGHRLVNRPYTVVLLSPSFKLPPEIENSVSLMDYPLPDLDDLRGVIGRLEQDLNGSSNIQFKFNNEGRDREELARALQGLTLTEAMTALKKALVVQDGVLDVRAITVVLEEKRGTISRNGIQYSPATESLDSVGSLDNLKGFLAEAELARLPEALAFGLEPVRGVLVGGIPGTGKSLVAKACAGGRHPCPLLRLSVSEVLARGGGIVGQGQAGLQHFFKVAEAVAPVVVWVDEIDKAFGGAGGELDGGTRRDMLADLLTWMQETTAPVFIVATANDVEILPVELVRRFTERFFVDLPGPKGRGEILAIHLSKRQRSPGGFDMKQLAQATAGFTGAEIENAVQAGLRKAFARLQAGNGGGDNMTTADILAAVAEIKPISKTMAAQLDVYRRWEARRANSEDPEPVVKEKLTLEL